MTMNLYWAPIVTDGNYLSDGLKFALRNRYSMCVDITMDHYAIDYLEGLVDAGIEDAQKLLDAIVKHGEIRVYEQ